MRCHLRGVGLQRVVQGIEAKPEQGHRDGGKPPCGADCEHQIGDAAQKSTTDGEAALTEPVDQHLDARRIEEPADCEGADDQPHRGKAKPKALVEIGAHIGEGAPADRRLDQHSDNDDTGEAIGEHGHIVGDKAARRLLRSCRRTRPWIGQ